MDGPHGPPRGIWGLSQFCRAGSAPHEKRGEGKVPSNFAEYDSAGDRAAGTPDPPEHRCPRDRRPPAERLDITHPLTLIFGVWVNFSIRKGGNVVKLTVRDKESIQEAVRRFRKLVERSGVKKEMRRREFYEKPSEVKRRAKLRAERRNRRNRLMAQGKS